MFLTHMAARYRERRERERERSPFSRRRREYVPGDDYYSYNDLDYEREAHDSSYDRPRTGDYGYYPYESVGRLASSPFTRRSLHSPPHSSHHFFPRHRYNDEYRSIPHPDYRHTSSPRTEYMGPPLPDYLDLPPHDYVPHSREYLTRPPRDFVTPPPRDFATPPQDYASSLYIRDYPTIPSSIALRLSPAPSPPPSPLPPPSPAPLYSSPPSPPLPLFPPSSPPSTGLQWRGSNDLLYTNGPDASDVQDSSIYYNEGERSYSIRALDTSDLSNALQILRRSIKSEDLRSNDLKSEDGVKDSVFMRLDSTQASSVKSEDTSTGNYACTCFILLLFYYFIDYTPVPMDISTPEPDPAISDTVDHYIKIAKDTVNNKSAINDDTVDVPSLIPPLFDNAMSHDVELNPAPPFIDDMSRDALHDVALNSHNVSLSHDTSHDLPCEDLELLFLRLTAIRSMLSKQTDSNLDDTNTDIDTTMSDHHHIADTNTAVDTTVSDHHHHIADTNTDIDASASDHNVVSTTYVDTTDTDEYHQYADSNAGIDITTDHNADIDTTVDPKVESHYIADANTDIVNVPNGKDSQLAVKLIKDLEVANVADPHIDSTADAESLSNVVNTDIKAQVNADTSTDINVDSDTVVVHVGIKPDTLDTDADIRDTDADTHGNTEVVCKVDIDTDNVNTNDASTNDVKTETAGVKFTTDPASPSSTDNSLPVTHSSSPLCTSTSVSVAAMDTESAAMDTESVAMNTESVAVDTESVAMDTESVAMDTGFSDTTIKSAELSSVKVCTKYIIIDQ